jgi:hypothetical protein
VRGRHTVIAALAACALLAAASGAVARSTGPAPTISIGPIVATFIPKAFETRYSVSRYHLNGKPETVTVTWTLHLKLVDKAGAPDAGTPGSGAAVDLGCTNNGVGLPEHPQKTVVERGNQTPYFIWHHPDPADSKPPGRYHCDHQDMGPHGHQGLITIVVADKDTECTASFKGTNSSTAQSETDGTASAPKCKTTG